MKRPERIIKWLYVEREKDGIFVDYNGKPAFKYSVEIPYWIARAYKPYCVKVEIRGKHLSFKEMQEEENSKDAQEYLRKNWSKKLDKMRKLNHNYVLVATQGKSIDWFNSVEDYEKYHKELQELNKKYLKKKE